MIIVLHSLYFFTNYFFFFYLWNQNCDFCTLLISVPKSFFSFLKWDFSSDLYTKTQLLISEKKKMVLTTHLVLYAHTHGRTARLRHTLGMQRGAAVAAAVATKGLGIRHKVG